MRGRATALLGSLLPISTFARSVGVLLSGTAGAQLITVLASPLLTRLYTSADYGLAAVFGGLIALIGVVASLRYEMAIPLPEDDNEAANIVALSLALVVATAVLCCVLVATFATPFAEMLGVPVLAGYMWLVPVAVLLRGSYHIFNYWSVRTKNFGAIARTRIKQSLASVTIQIAAFGLGGFALLLGQVAAQSTGTGSLARPALMRQEFREVTLVGMCHSAVKYRRFPLLMTWGGLLNVGSSTLPALLMASVFNATSAGLFALAHRIVALPINLAATAVSKVFLSGAAEKYKKGHLGEQVLMIQRYLADLGMPLFLLIFLLAPNVFDFAFGQEWRVSGEMARWMSIGIYFQFCASPISQTYAVIGKQQLFLVMQFTLFSGRVCSLLLGFYIGDSIQTVILFSLASAIIYILFLATILTEVRASMRKALFYHFQALVVSSICISPCLFIYLGLGSKLQNVLLALLAIILVLMRYILLLRSDRLASRASSSH